MADEITPSSVEALMDAVKHFNCEPAVFDVKLRASNHLAGYSAYANFRTCQPAAADSVSAHGDTPEDALQDLLTVLKTRWGHCPHCKQPLNGKDQEASHDQ